jgi:hypothetical protein
MESDTGWWLITHPDHARLAGAFAAAWGNARFRRPEPRARVLHGIAAHDDGWAKRDASPSITRQGKPSAFSTELVGKYSAFEEIDLAEYLAVRDRAVKLVAEEDAYAGLLIAMHTANLLGEHADRSTIAPEQLPLLDRFLADLGVYMETLRAKIAGDARLSDEEKSSETIEQHFRLLQACDNLSLLTCVAYASPAHLLHPLPLSDGGTAEVRVEALGSRHFRLDPWPFAEARLSFAFPARHVSGHTFESSAELTAAFHAAPEETLSVTLSQ